MKRTPLALAAIVLGTFVATSESGPPHAELLQAAYRDDLPAVKRLLEGGANPTFTNPYGATPLEQACRNGNAVMIQLLLDAGAKVDARGAGGASMLMIAARTGDPASVKALLNAGAAVNATDPGKQTALMWAAAEGHATVVKQLLDTGAKVEPPLRSGFDAWFFAAREGRREVIRVLLQSRQDVNRAMRLEKGNGRSPRKRMSALMLAMENGHFELAAELLKAGADANDQRSAYTPLHALSWVRKPNRGDGIDGAPPPEVRGGMTSLQFVDQLVKHGANINEPLRQGGTMHALHLKGATPILLAAKRADLPLIKKLIEHGADPLLANERGTTPLMAAAGLGVRTLEEGSPATEAEALACVEYLLGLGGDVNTVNKNSETAMHGAAYASFPRMVYLLARKGAKVETWNVKGKAGSTPLLIAQGFRPGNFKPDVATMNAISEVMRAAGVEPPPPPERSIGKPKKYEP